VTGDRRDLRCIAYGVVRIAHLALFLAPGRDNAGLRRTVLEFGTTSAVAIALLVAGRSSILARRPRFGRWPS